MRTLLQITLVLVALAGAAAAQSVSAILEPETFLEFSSGQAGKLEAILVEEGEAVTAGSVLAELDAKEQKQRVVLAQTMVSADGQISRARAQIAQASQLLTRLKRAQARGAARKWEVDQAAQALRLAQAEEKIALDDRARLEAQLKLEEALLERRKLKAPFDGVVLEVQVAPGAQLEARTIILTLADLSSLEAIAFVPVAWLERLSVGDIFDVEISQADTSRTAAKVKSIDPRLDPASQTVRLVLTVDNTEQKYFAGASLSLDAP